MLDYVLNIFVFTLMIINFLLAVNITLNLSTIILPTSETWGTFIFFSLSLSDCWLLNQGKGNKGRHKRQRQGLVNVLKGCQTKHVETELAFSFKLTKNKEIRGVTDDANNFISRVEASSGSFWCGSRAQVSNSTPQLPVSCSF